MKLNDKICLKCSTTYSPTGRAQKYCISCAVIVERVGGRDRMRKHRLNSPAVPNRRKQTVGVGKGGANTSYKEDSQYVNGIGRFMKIRKTIKEDRRFCNRCGKDLINASRWHWCVHHIDHDRSNNSNENLELLCKRCHQIEHDCHKAFECVTTREQSRRALD